MRQFQQHLKLLLLVSIACTLLVSTAVPQAQPQENTPQREVLDAYAEQALWRSYAVNLESEQRLALTLGMSHYIETENTQFTGVYQPPLRRVAGQFVLGKQEQQNLSDDGLAVQRQTRANFDVIGVDSRIYLIGEQTSNQQTQTYPNWTFIPRWDVTPDIQRIADYNAFRVQSDVIALLESATLISAPVAYGENLTQYQLQLDPVEGVVILRMDIDGIFAELGFEEQVYRDAFYDALPTQSSLLMTVYLDNATGRLTAEEIDLAVNLTLSEEAITANPNEENTVEAAAFRYALAIEQSRIYSNINDSINIVEPIAQQ